MSLGNKLKELRLEKGLSQLKLAKELDLAQSSICNWETGKQEPSALIALKIANYFNISIDYLLSEDEEKTHTSPAVARSKDNIIKKHNIELTDEQYQTLLEIIKQADKNKD